METTTKRIANYTGHGWSGSKCNGYRDAAEITKELRGAIKERYPECKFSVTCDKYSGGQSIAISLMSAPFDVFTETEEKEKGHSQVNHYYIPDSKKYTEEAKKALYDVTKMVNEHNYNDSDATTDYFDTNFYLHLSVGKWDKPFVKS